MHVPRVRVEKPKDMVASSFKKCALTIDDNGDEDEEISCFKPKRPCAEGYKVLKGIRSWLQLTIHKIIS